MKIILIGLLISTDSSRSVAAFHVDGKLELRRLGQRIGDMQLDWIGSRSILYLKAKDGWVAMRPGDDESDPVPYVSYRFIERKNDEVVMSETLRDYIAGPNLAKAMMEASSQPYLIDGECKGFMIDNFDENSVFEAAGFQEGDVILYVNGYYFNNALSAVKGLLSVKSEPEFEVRFLRLGVEKTLKVKVK